MVTINGIKTAADGDNLKSYLIENEYNLERIAVEINEVIVPKKQYSETTLKTDDKVEIVSFVGGG